MRTDVGTYDSSRLEWDKRYVARDSRFVPMGGETCQPSPFTEYGPARAELARMHWTYLNRGFNRRVIQQWKENGLYAEAEKLLGLSTRAALERMRPGRHSRSGVESGSDVQESGLGGSHQSTRGDSRTEVSTRFVRLSSDIAS